MTTATTELPADLETARHEQTIRQRRAWRSELDRVPELQGRLSALREQKNNQRAAQRKKDDYGRPIVTPFYDTSPAVMKLSAAISATINEIGDARQAERHLIATASGQLQEQLRSVSQTSELSGRLGDLLRGVGVDGWSKSISRLEDAVGDAERRLHELFAGHQPMMDTPMPGSRMPADGKADLAKTPDSRPLAVIRADRERAVMEARERLAALRSRKEEADQLQQQLCEIERGKQIIIERMLDPSSCD